MPRITANTIPGVHITRKPSGRIYYRHRKTQEPIKFSYPSPEFDAEVARLDALVAAKAKAKPEPGAGSLGALIKAYRSSTKFTELAPRTREDYNDKLDYLKPGQHALLSGFTRGDVLRIRDKAHKDRKFHFANYVVTVMSAMFKWGVEREFLTFNPAAGIPPIARPKHMPTRNRVWTEAERDIVLDAARGGLRKAIALGRWTAAREQDVLAMTWECVGKDGFLRWKIQKNGDQHAPWPIHPRLAEILAEGMDDIIPLPSTLIVLGARSGRPYTEDGFRRVLFELIRRLEVAGEIRPGLTFHGLRHTMGTELANAGASNREIMIALGQRTEAMAIHYSKGFDRDTQAQSAFNRLANDESAEIVSIRPNGYSMDTRQQSLPKNPRNRLK